jgi:hypothetical protein
MPIYEHTAQLAEKVMKLMLDIKTLKVCRSLYAAPALRPPTMLLPVPSRLSR